MGEGGGAPTCPGRMETLWVLEGGTRRAQPRLRSSSTPTPPLAVPGPQDEGGRVQQQHHQHLPGPEGRGAAEDGGLHGQGEGRPRRPCPPLPSPPHPHATKQPAWRACHPAGHPPLRCCDIYKQALAPGLRVPAGHPPPMSPQAKGSARHPRRMRATPGASVARMVPSGVGGPSGDCRGNGSRPLRGPPGRGASQRRPRRFGHSRHLCRGTATPAPALRGRSNALGCFLLTQP